MTFLKSVETCFIKYADFYGRASRPEFWWFFLFSMICAMVAFALHPVIEVVVGLGLFLPSIAVASRRLHDIDKSGWLQLVGIIPLVGWIIVIIWYASDGHRKNNRFGKSIYKNQKRRKSIYKNKKRRRR